MSFCPEVSTLGILPPVGVKVAAALKGSGAGGNGRQGSNKPSGHAANEVAS